MDNHGHATAEYSRKKTSLRPGDAVPHLPVDHITVQDSPTSLASMITEDAKKVTLRLRDWLCPRKKARRNPTRRDWPMLS